MKKWSKGTFFLIVLCLANIVGHLFVYPLLPDSIPIHWGTNNIANGYGPKIMDIFLSMIPLLLFLLMWIIPKADPKHENYIKFQSIWKGFELGLIVFLIVMSWMTELVVFHIIADGSSMISLIVCGGIGILFVALGNYMPRIRPNYMFGIKTPWALQDEHNWQRTHRMGGFIFVMMGILFLVSGFVAIFLPAIILYSILFISTLGGCIWLYIYSFFVYKKILK